MADTVSSIQQGGGGDYTDIATWEADSDVSAGRWIGEIDDNNEYLNENLVVDGADGTADNFVWLRASSNNRHAGVAGTGHARMRDTSGHVIQVSDNMFVCSHLEIIQDGTGSSDEGVRVNTGVDDALLSNLIIRATSETASQDGIYTGNWAIAALHVDHCIVYGFERGCYHAQNYNGFNDQTWNIDYCLAEDQGGGTGADDGGIVGRVGSATTVTFNINNSWAANCTGGAFSEFQVSGNTPTWSGTANISDGQTGSTGEIDVEVEFTSSFNNVTLTDSDPGSGENIHVNDIAGNDYGIADEDTETVTQNGTDRTGSEPAPQTTDGVTKVQDFSTDVAGNSRSGFSIGPFEFVGGGGQTVTIGQATETDSAFAVTASEALAIGQATETDSALSINGAEARSIGLASETDSAFSVGYSRAAQLGQSLETDTAFALTASELLSIGQAQETDSALAIAAAEALSIGQPVETDTAFALTPSESLAIGQAVETDSALPVTVQGEQVITIGLSSETDTAFALGHSRAAQVGQASETDTAFSVGATEARAIGQPSEADSAFAVTASESLAIGQAVETDTAFPVSTPDEQIVVIGIAGETDSALALAHSRAATLGQAQETDSSLALNARRTISVGQSAESDQAFTLTAKKALSVGQPIVVDSAPALSASEALSIGLAQETDTALSLRLTPLRTRESGSNRVTIDNGPHNIATVENGPSNLVELQ